MEIDVPDLRIIDESTANAIDHELSRRSTGKGRSGNGQRAHYLLSGLIKCGVCGSSFTLAGKDYYRCAGQRERGTCTNGTSVRKAPLEDAVLSALQSELLTADMAQLFAEEFSKEIARRTKGEDTSLVQTKQRMAELEREIEALSQNLLAGVVGPTITKMLADREKEKGRLTREITASAKPKGAIVLPHPVLLRRFEEKVRDLRASLNDPNRGGAVELLQDLLETFTIYPDLGDGAHAEVVAETAKLLAFANEKGPRRSRVGASSTGSPRGVSSSIVVVAGTGFEPVTFRL